MSGIKTALVAVGWAALIVALVVLLASREPSLQWIAAGVSVAICARWWFQSREAEAVVKQRQDADDRDRLRRIENRLISIENHIRNSRPNL